jgi:alpha-mannosidase
MMKPSKIFLPLFFAWVVVCVRAGADSLTDQLASMQSGLAKQFSVPIEQWRFQHADLTNAAQPDFDDSAWQSVSPGFSWSGRGTSVWFRTKINIPTKVLGQSIAGFPVRLELGMNCKCEIYVDGLLREGFRHDTGLYTLTEHARPGQTFIVALRGIKGQRKDQFHYARLSFDPLPELDEYLDEATFVGLLMNRVSADQQADLRKELSASESEVHFTDITTANLDSVRAQLKQAQTDLLPVAAITKKYDVYYIGHAHIDMNWLWTWPETVDVCHRTWNSAMNLMDEFPQFCFVQSQPGAYVPIEKEYPQEFARMQAMTKRGQWDPVGGLWDESDTDIPSGEGLARSFLLGQRYFKAHFGKYAVTGWLPDSFGHTWQLPQIMRLAGIRYYYHMRCGNGMEFTWWEAPDGSRVLKANTHSYDEKPKLEQLIVPMENESRFELPQSVVIFGVGDHGGGPTREQILRIQSFQHDPIFPRVHLISADKFFEQLAKQPAAASLPVIDTGLQYTFEGCYTTHADMKKALRRSENNLYSAEVLSSLAAMMGQPYPVEAFDDAWKPTAFAQFHDIAAGSAIHSTYDWMHQQLAPAFRFEREQTDKSLRFLTASADTRGPASEAIVVWNTLSFARDGVVKASVTAADQYHSVVDNQGHRFPAQATEDGKLVFVARSVPAFGHAVYFPETGSCPSDGITLRDAGDAYEIQTPSLMLQINKATGAIARLYSKSAKWNVFGNAHNADALQLLGDSGSAWNIRYTGENQILSTEGAKVSVVDQGPVFVRVRVIHVFGKSSYTQDVTVYGALPRVDIPTVVNWQEEHELLKIRFPVNVTHPQAGAQIPFGSTVRPDNGQECPGQKWMDVSQTVSTPAKDATPLDLSPLFNANCTQNFDGDGNSYPAKLLPAAGLRQLGPDQVPFNLAFNPSGQSNQSDNVIASGQQFKLPADIKGDTLYLLAACAKGSQGTEVGFQLSGDKTECEPFDLNDWEIDTHPDNAVGLSFAYRKTRGGRDKAPPKMWIVLVPFPEGATGLVLPRNPKVHLFAATISTKPTQALYGLSVLNNCKYGFDASNNVFRLTALRSSSRPDPHPDDGLQQFTYSLYPHAGSWRAAHTDEQALALNIPLLATVTLPHPPTDKIPRFSVVNIGGKGDLIVTALKHSEDGRGYILRFYEADGHDTEAQINFDQPMHVEETDILERPLPELDNGPTVQGNSVTLPVGHNRIVTLHFWADAAIASSELR